MQQWTGIDDYQGDYTARTPELAGWMNGQFEAREEGEHTTAISYDELMKVVSENARTISQLPAGVEVETVTAQLENGQLVEYTELVDESQLSQGAEVSNAI